MFPSPFLRSQKHLPSPVAPHILANYHNSSLVRSLLTPLDQRSYHSITYPIFYSLAERCKFLHIKDKALIKNSKEKGKKKGRRQPLHESRIFIQLLSGENRESMRSCAWLPETSVLSSSCHTSLMLCGTGGRQTRWQLTSPTTRTTQMKTSAWCRTLGVAM